MSTVDVEITIKRPEHRHEPRTGKSSGDERGPGIPRIARLMALAIKFQEMVERGEIRDYADLARLGYVTRARMTQIMNLSLLAPDIQMDILIAANPSVVERHLRRLAKIPEWDEQQRVWQKLRSMPVN